MLTARWAAVAAVATTAAVLLAGCTGESSDDVAPAPDTTDTATTTTEPAPAETTDAPAQITALTLGGEGMLGGDAVGMEFDAGEADTVSVVFTGAEQLTGGEVLLVVRNNTADTITGVEISGTVRDGDGGLIGSGRSQGLAPEVIPPGGLALGYLYVDSEIGEGFDIEYQIDSTPIEDAFASGVDLRVDELAPNEDGFVGTAVNDSGDTVGGPISVQVFCFDESGVLFDDFGTYTDQDEVEAGASVSFSVDFYGDPCPTYAVGVSGYSF